MFQQPALAGTVGLGTLSRVLGHGTLSRLPGIGALSRLPRLGRTEHGALSRSGRSFVAYPPELCRGIKYLPKKQPWARNLPPSLWTSAPRLAGVGSAGDEQRRQPRDKAPIPGRRD